MRDCYDPLKQWERDMAALKIQHEPFLVDIPEGTSGEWTVDRFKADNPLQLLRCWRDGRALPEGTYTRLSKKGTGMFMTDTPAELNDAAELFRRAKGHVLISGLGLGMIPKALLGLKRDPVTRITILELEEDVIKLVGPTLDDPRIEIIHHDCFTWNPPAGTKFDIAWHDIWPDMCSDNIPQFAALRKHYQPFMKPKAPQLVWAEDWL